MFEGDSPDMCSRKYCRWGAEWTGGCRMRKTIFLLVCWLGCGNREICINHPQRWEGVKFWIDVKLGKIWLCQWNHTFRKQKILELQKKGVLWLLPIKSCSYCAWIFPIAVMAPTGQISGWKWGENLNLMVNWSNFASLDQMCSPATGWQQSMPFSMLNWHN
jgi:hypothetical protein